MTREEEIAKIRQEQAELNKRLRALKDDGLIEVGMARIARRQTYAYRQNEEFNLSYQVQMRSNGGKPLGTHYRTFYTGTRRECIDAIPGIIETLEGLYKAAGGEIIRDVKVTVGKDE